MFIQTEKQNNAYKAAYLHKYAGGATTAWYCKVMAKFWLLYFFTVVVAVRDSMNLRQPFQISPTPSIGYQVPTPTTTTDVKSPLPPVNLNAQVWSCFYLIDIYKSKWFYEVKGQDLIPGWLNSWIPKKKNALLWCSIFSKRIIESMLVSFRYFSKWTTYRFDYLSWKILCDKPREDFFCAGNKTIQHSTAPCYFTF